MEQPVKFVIRVSWYMMAMQIIFALFCTFGLVYALIAAIPRGSVTMIIISIIVLGGLAYIGWGNAFSTIEVSEESVTVNVFYGKFRIRWDEVKLIVFNAPLFALMSDEKRLVLSIAYAGKNTEALLNFIHQQIQQRNIVFEENTAPFPLTHHNVRV